MANNQPKSFTSEGRAMLYAQGVANRAGDKRYVRRTGPGKWYAGTFAQIARFKVSTPLLVAHPREKRTEQHARQQKMCLMWKAGVSVKQIALTFNVHISSVYYAIHKWRHHVKAL